jgi:glutaredoxin-dependent peroxiredoxin
MRFSEIRQTAVAACENGIFDKGYSMTLKVGDKAPLFTLKTKNASGLVDVKIADNVGVCQTLLLFFPLAFTSVCTEELCGISAGLEEFKAMEANVYGISVDSPFAQEAFAKASHITVPLLSDFNKDVSLQYGVLFDELIGLKGVSKRSAFVIGRDGLIKYAEWSDNPAKVPDFDKIRAVLKG